MGTLLRNWKPHHKFTKALRLIIKIIAYLILIGFFVLPFCNFSENISQVSKWAWLGCALLNLDTFTEYKNAKKEKLFYPIASLYAILTLIYLHNYWRIIRLSVVVCGSIIIGLLEFIVTVALTKTVRFCEKQKYVEYHPKMIHGFVLGGLYVCSITFFVMGHFVSQLLLFIFGGIALLFLAVSILLSLSNGLSAKKNIINLIGFILDTLSFLTLMIYLIYKIPTQFENLQTIITTIVAAVLGGALTLVGVAWTIKKSDKDKREEELQKAKPLFSLLSAIDFDTAQKFEVKKDFTEIDVKLNNVTEINYPKVIFWGAFLNSDCSNFTIEEIYIGRGKTVRPYSQNAIIKNQKFLLVMQSCLWNTQIDFIIILQDTFSRLFYYKLGIVDECVPNISEKIMKIINFTEISENEFEEIKRKDKITNND